MSVLPLDGAIEREVGVPVMKRGLIWMGLGMLVASSLLGVAGVAQDWVHIVQAVVGTSILGVVLMIVGAVVTIMDVIERDRAALQSNMAALPDEFKAEVMRQYYAQRGVPDHE